MDAPIPFQPLLRNKPFKTYTSGHLPHWRQDGCTYFVTFRTADSLPADIAGRQRQERSDWLKKTGTTIDRLTDSEKRTLARELSIGIDRELDHHHGSCPLKKREAASVVAQSLQFFHAARYRLGDFVVMPNHVHALLTPLHDFSLEKILHSVKRHTARAINQKINTCGPFWQRDSYDHIVRDAKQLNQFKDYIAANPAKAGISPDDVVSHRASYKTW